MNLNHKFVRFIAAVAVFTTVYLAYYFFIGIPKTQARNYYNLALEYIAFDDYENYYKNLQAAYNSWPERYIADELDAYSKLLNEDDR